MNESLVKKTYRVVGKIFLAVALWFFLCADVSEAFPNRFFQPNAGTVVTIICFLQRLDALLGGYSLLKEVLFIAIVVGVFKFYKKQVKLPIIYNVLAVLCSFLYLLSESFYHKDSSVLIFGDFFVFMIAVIRGIGLGFALRCLFSFILSKLECNSGTGEDKEKTFKWNWLKVFLVMLVCWIPCLISTYPGIYYVDTQIQLKQFFGYEAMSDAHPPFITFFEGVFVKLGNIIGNPTFGLFLGTAVQFLILLLLFSYGLWFFIKKVNSNVFGWCAVIFGATTSIFFFYACNVGSKDSIYSICLLFMSISFLNILDGIGKEEKRRGVRIWAVAFAVSTLFSCLARHNGIYVAIVMFVFIVIFVIKNGTVNSEKILLSTILSVGIIFFYLIDYVVYPLIGVEKDSQSLIYINMVQQTARIALEYPGDFSSEDIEIINKITDFSRFEERYDPLTSDGVKFITDWNASSEDIKAFRKVWFKKALKHPGVFFEAVYNMVYGFFAPVAENTINSFGDWYYACDIKEIDFRIPSFILGMRHLYEMVLKVWVTSPVERLIHNPGIYLWAMLFCLAYVMYKKAWKYIIAFIPGIMTVMFYAVTPSYFGHPRYCFPMVYGLFMYIAICIEINKKKE